jgi:hypothetical protein
MAVVLWESIAGRRLFRGEEALETLQEVMTAPIPSLRRMGAPISQAVDDAILRGLSRDLDTRYKTSAEFIAALDRAGGRQSIAAPAEVACLIEALFGERLRVRHEKIRFALPGRDVERVLEVSGLNARPAPTPEMREREKREIENIAPPAPSARYAFGASEKLERQFASARVRMAVLAGVAAALLLVGVFLVLKRDASPTRDTVAFEPAGPMTIRRVVVPLPFPAAKVMFDDQVRQISPPTDLASFDVPREAGLRHRVTVLGVDGTRAEAYVLEAEGVARPEGTGFSIEPLETYDDEPSPGVIELPETPGAPKRVFIPRPHAPVTPRTSRAAAAPSTAPSSSHAPATPPPSEPGPKPIGTVKDGFTRLR